MSADVNRPEGLDLLDSIFGSNANEEEPAAEEKVEEVKPKKEKKEKGKEGAYRPEDDFFRESEDVPKKSYKEDRPRDEKPAEKAERKELNIEDMFEFSERSPDPEEKTDTEKTQKQDENPVSENERRGVRPKNPVKPIRKRVSGKAVEQILEGLLRGIPSQNQAERTGQLISVSTGQIIDIQGGTLIIGASPSQANLVLEGNPTISRRHAAIENRSGRFYVRDLGSLNGTRLNGNLLRANEEMELRNGDRIIVSNVTFEFREE